MPSYVFNLTWERAERLHTYLRDYRQVLLGKHLVSSARNQLQRLLQSVQGKLIAQMDEAWRQSQTQVSLGLLHEEIQALKTMATDFLVSVANGSRKVEHRNAVLADLAALKAALEQLYQMPPTVHINR